MSLVNEQLKHEVYIQRLATELLNTNIYPSLKDAEKAIRAVLGEYDSITTPKELSAVTKAILGIVDDTYGQAWNDATDKLNVFAVYEADYYSGLIGDANSIDLKVPAERTILSYMSQALMVLGEGERVKVGAWSYFVGKATDSLAESYNNIIKAGYTQGATVGQLKKAIRDFNESLARNQAEALARTGAQHYANSAREAMVQVNADVIEKRYYLSVLDNRTTLGCRSLHGKTWPIDDDTYIRLPRHMNCRSSYVYLLQGQDHPEGMMPAVGSGEKYPEDADKMPRYRGRKDSASGKFEVVQVPANTTADAWLKMQSRAFIEDALGKTKAALFLDGKMKLERMTDAYGEPLTLDELRQRDRAAFERAGI